MNADIVVPQLGATGGDVRLIAWHVKPGDFVSAGTALVTIETDKATEELPAHQDGYIDSILADAGLDVPIGAVIATLRLEKSGPQASMHVTDRSAERSDSQSSTSNVSVGDSKLLPAKVADRQRMLASPAARRLAREHNINLADLSGSGASGVIHLIDVEKAVAPEAPIPADATIRERQPIAKSQEHLEEDGVANPQAAVGSQNGQRQPLSHTRRALARRVTRSKTEIPHFYVTATVDMEEAERARAWLVEASDQLAVCKPTINDLIVRAAALTLRDVPRLNVRYFEDSLESLPSIDIGVVIGFDDSVVVPIVRNADQIDIYALAHKTQELKQRAADKELTVDEMEGGTLSISNLGMYGVEQFVAIINPPQVSMLACGAIQPRPVVRHDSIEIRRVMTMTLSVDHRAADGVLAARFLNVFQRYLEVPQLLLLGTLYERRT